MSTNVTELRHKRASDRLPSPRPAVRDRALEQALSDDSIVIVFQPQIDPLSGRVEGA